MPDGNGRLESWKEIAAYLGREVRTVQLWEKNEGLPVHRHQHSKQGSVHAFPAELDAWRAARTSSPAPADFPPAPVQPLITRIPRPGWIGAAVALVALVASVWFLRSGRATSSRLPTSVAVLPFLDLSPQRDSEYFSDGLSEEIIDALSRVPNLHVVARTSSFAFKGRNVDIREIGRQLNVNGVIEGSVRKSGDNLRITAQLNRVDDGYHLWSRTWDGKLSQMFSVQEEISEAIASELRAGHPAQPRSAPTSDAEAWRLYAEGRYLFNKFEYPESNYKAIDRYQQAIARDPHFAAAWAGIADAYSYLAENLVVAPREVEPKAKAAAEKALELDDSSAEAHTSLGIAMLDYDRNIAGAQREFVRAMQLNPGFGWARHWYAHSLEAQDRVGDALREMQAARDMDPLSVPINWDIVGELIILKRYDEALQQAARDKELFPGVPLFDYMIVVANWRKGDEAAARTALKPLMTRPETANDPLCLTLIAAQQARDGDETQARRSLAQMETMRGKQYIDAVMFAEVAKALNDRAQLQRWLRRADEERSPFFVYLRGYAPYWGLDLTDLERLENPGRG